MRSTHSTRLLSAPTGGRWETPLSEVSDSVRLAEVMVMGSVLTVAETTVAETEASGMPLLGGERWR